MTQTSIKKQLKIDCKVGIESTKTRVVVMVTNARRDPHIDCMKSSSDDYKADVGMSLCISYHHYYPCFGASITTIPTLYIYTCLQCITIPKEY